MKVNAKILLPLLALIIICGGIAFLVTHSNSIDKNPSNSQSKPASSKLTVVTPTEVVKDFAKYTGKTVQVKGLVVQIGDKQEYYVVSQEAKPSAIKLDFSKTKLDPQAFANNPPTTQTQKYSPKGAVVITGELAKAERGKPSVLIVDSIK